MKIKTTKQLTLPQLIEWAQDNIEEATKKVHRVNENEVLGDHVRFTEVYSDLEVRLHGYIPFDTTFTVEVEEEITEDTIIKGLVEFGNDGYGPHFFQCSGSSINEQKDFDSEAFYIMNDDKTMTLIWKNGKMVE